MPLSNSVNAEELILHFGARLLSWPKMMVCSAARGQVVVAIFGTRSHISDQRPARATSLLRVQTSAFPMKALKSMFAGSLNDGQRIFVERNFESSRKTNPRGDVMLCILRSFQMFGVLKFLLSSFLSLRHFLL